MNKGYAQIAIPSIILIILLFFGLKGTFEEDVPETIDALKKDICIPVEDKWHFCFTNQTGVVVDGEFKNLRLNLESNNQNITCDVGYGIFKLQTVCKDEFGYVYEKQNFKLHALIDNKYAKVISKYEVYGLLAKIAKNKEVIGKNLAKDAQAMLILRGAIYLYEHWDELRVK